MTEKRTDLALEARESFPRNHVEIQGVVLEKKKCLQGKVKITTVIIRDEAGSKSIFLVAEPGLAPCVKTDGMQKGIDNTVLWIVYFHPQLSDDGCG